MAATSLKTVIGDLRGYVLGLKPVHPVGPAFEAALGLLVEDMNRVPHCRFDVRIETGMAARLTQEQAGQLLPIAREAMSNSLRHSGAQTGLLALESEDGVVRLIVEDDGAGFDAATVHEGGRGLNNMETRATMLGGRLEIRSYSGGGTRVECRFPLRQTHQKERGDAAN
jgi:NarL family two-component system sensor histidine kinase LiaS